jgi:hypothetical protein
VQRDGQRLRRPRPGAEPAVPDPLHQPVRDHPGERLRRGVRAGELRLLVQVAVAQLAEHGVQHLGGGTDVHDEPGLVELGAPEGGVDDERRAVQALGRSEHRAPEAVRHHHGVADGHAEHGFTLRRR